MKIKKNVHEQIISNDLKRQYVEREMHNNGQNMVRFAKSYGE